MGQKVKKRQDFLAPVTKGRQDFAEFCGPIAFGGSYPRI
jgi:hypothetical protein